MQFLCDMSDTPALQPIKSAVATDHVVLAGSSKVVAVSDLANPQPTTNFQAIALRHTRSPINT